MKLSTGSSLLDRFLNGGYERDVITTIYGPAGSGKTTLAMLSAISVVQEGKRVIFIDTEGGFSVERLKQLTSDHEQVLDKILFLKPTTFPKQREAFDKLRPMVSDDVGLIVVDSIAMLYRMELGTAENIYDVNRDLGRQIGYLTEIARTKGIPVIITNQVYANFEDRRKINMVGGDILKYGSKCLLQVETMANKARKLTLMKHRAMPENQKVFFDIVEDGIKEVKKEGFRPIGQ